MQASDSRYIKIDVYRRTAPPSSVARAKHYLPVTHTALQTWPSFVRGYITITNTISTNCQACTVVRELFDLNGPEGGSDIWENSDSRTNTRINCSSTYDTTG